MDFEDLKNPELQEKLKAVKTPEDILALAKEGGFELTDEQLEQVSGGTDWDILDPLTKGRCPKCYSNEILLTDLNGKSALKCTNCGTVFGVGQ